MNKWIKDFNKTTYHANVNVNLMEESVTQIKSGIIVNVEASIKNIIYVKKIIIAILLHVVVKMENIRKYYWRFKDYVWWNYIEEWKRNKKAKNIL